ncbi:MAG: 30S ribosomal protein S4 [Candidatus Zipacnadales bacterium]
MARYTKAVCRLCRREGQKLYLKGMRCYGPKCGFERRQEPPGAGSGGTQGGRKGRVQKPSDYALQLRAKQKCRRIYGVLERQFRRYIAEAQRQRGLTGEVLLQQLETRLDNVVYRVGLAPSRAAARQAVRHRHIAVNGRVVDIPSYQVKEGDVIEVRERSRSKRPFVEAKEAAGGSRVPQWLQVDWDQWRATVTGVPSRDQIDTDVNEALIVEYYAR